MTDIVEQLRFCPPIPRWASIAEQLVVAETQKIFNRAADEIERLRCNAKTDAKWMSATHQMMLNHGIDAGSQMYIKAMHQVRDAVLEEAAMIAEECDVDDPSGSPGLHGQDIADQIRALKEQHNG